MTFHKLGLSAPILTALEEQGYQKPSPIQEKAIPHALEGRDVLGIAQTGTGKTCAFSAPILQRLSAQPKEAGHIRALILTPTRELAIQIGESIESYGTHLKLRHTVIFGGVSQNPQVDALRKGTDILVATPGRLMDLHNQGFVTLEHLEIFVLDEADRMLDMGFIHDVKKILKWLPKEKQTMLFSATMPPEITHLVNSLLRDPVRVEVDPVSSPVEAIQQSVYMVDRSNKTRLLATLVKELNVKNALVFTRTKHGANKVARDLGKAGITAAAIHGNKSQTARQQALSDFKAGNLQCLVATDIAARGLDIEELSHVFNYNLPEVPETYVHRIGRTGRAGRGGQAIAFCDFSEQGLLKDIEKLIGRKLPLVENHPFPMEVFEVPKKDKQGRPVNAEDLEAREAARTKRKAQDEQKKAAAEKQEAKKNEPKKQEPRKQEPKKAKQAEPESIVKKAAQKVKEVAQQVVEAATEEKPKNRRKKGKVAQQLEQAEKLAQTAVEPEPDEVDDFDPSEYYTPANREKPRMARPGTFLDTGDAMPCTEFERPNPLDSDVIMDATARLLSSRKMPAPRMETSRMNRNNNNSRRRKKPAHTGETPAEQQAQENTVVKKAQKNDQPRRKAEQKPRQEGQPKAQGNGSGKPRRDRKPDAHRNEENTEARKNEGRSEGRKQDHKKSDQPRRSEQKGQHEGQNRRKKSGEATPAQKRDRARSGRNNSRRGLPPEPHTLHKDSTEQPSLMKPYYLDLGR